MKVFLTHPSCLGSLPLVSSSTFIHCFSCCHGSFLCVPLPCPSPACRAGELWQSCGSLVEQQKNSWALAFTPPVLDILFSQLLFPYSLFRSLHPAELVPCMAICIFFLIPGSLFTCATSLAQHSTVASIHGLPVTHKVFIFSVILSLRLIFSIYHPVFPPQFFLFQPFPNSPHFHFQPQQFWKTLLCHFKSHLKILAFFNALILLRTSCLFPLKHSNVFSCRVDLFALLTLTQHFGSKNCII